MTFAGAKSDVFASPDRKAARTFPGQSVVASNSMPWGEYFSFDRRFSGLFQEMRYQQWNVLRDDGPAAVFTWAER